MVSIALWITSLNQLVICHDYACYVMIFQFLSQKMPECLQISPDILICHEASPCFLNVTKDHHVQSPKIIKNVSKNMVTFGEIS